MVARSSRVIPTNEIKGFSESKQKPFFYCLRFAYSTQSILLSGSVRCRGIGLLSHNSTNEPYFESLLRVVFEAVFSSVVLVVSGSRVFAVVSSRLLNFQSLISNFDERGR